jgi:signal transduction histidine kinase
MDDSVEGDLTHEALIHDLNNVFETITEIAELLSSDKHWKSLAATLCRSVAQGRRLLGALPDRTPRLTAIIADAIQSTTDYCNVARKPRIRFVCEIDDNIRLPGSAKDWERVFVNLFLNTVQIMRKPGRIDVSAQQTDDSLTVTVSDNGPGIPPEIMPRLFRPNVSTKKTDSGRTGLGLHIVASIVHKYSGRVEAANGERGSGAIFTIILPFNDGRRESGTQTGD